MRELPVSFEIRDAVDVYAPRSAVREQALRLGFSRSDASELAIVVSELISNVLKYGVRGNIRFEQVSHAHAGAGLAITASDEGPPFHDLELAKRDGFNDRGPIDPIKLWKRNGIGAGLGAIIRLTDDFEVTPLNHGKAIRVVRYRTRKRRPP